MEVLFIVSLQPVIKIRYIWGISLVGVKLLFKSRIFVPNDGTVLQRVKGE